MIGRVLVGLLAVAAGAACIGATAEAKDPPRQFYGVIPQTAPTASDIELMQRDRVGMMRVLFNWPTIESRRGEYRWDYVDGVLRSATAAGIRVWPVLYGTPPWAQSAKRNRTCGQTCAPKRPMARRAFAEFAAAAVARYGRGGHFWDEPIPPGPPPPPPIPPPPPPDCLPLICDLPLPLGASSPSSAVLERSADRQRATKPLPVRAWQLWNEQNSPKYNGPRPNVHAYAKLIKAAGKAIRTRDRRADVTLGGMWGPPQTNAVIPTTRYLRKLYRVKRVKRAFDSIAVHPYSARLGGVLRQVSAVRRVADRSGDRRAGLWVTEVGWASGGPGDQGLVKTPRKQASLLRKSFRKLARKRAAWRVRGVHWYAWRDTSDSGICEWCAQAGLRTVGGDAKPAARVFRGLPRAG